MLQKQGHVLEEQSVSDELIYMIFSTIGMNAIIPPNLTERKTLMKFFKLTQSSLTYPKVKLQNEKICCRLLGLRM